MAVNIFSAANSNAKIYKHNGFSTSILDSFSSPSTTLAGLGWDGENILSSDWASTKIYKHSGFSSTVSDSFSSPNVNPTGLSWTGSNLISTDVGVGILYRHQGFSSSLSGLSSGMGLSYGTDWDGNLYRSSDTYDKIYRQNGFGGVVLSSFSSPSTQPTGISWDGYNLISADFTLGKIYKHSGFSSTISDSFSSPSTSPIGLAYDFYAPLIVSVNDSIAVTEDISVFDIGVEVGPVYEEISITEYVSLVLDVLNINIFDSIAIFDIFEHEGILNITAFTAISIVEDVDLLVSPNLSIFDSISIAEDVSFSFISEFHLVSVYDAIDILEANLILRDLLDVGDSIKILESVTLKILVYGIKITSPVNSSKSTVLTTDVSTIVSAGRLTMPNTIVGGKYGTDIPLTDLTNVSKANIGVIIFPVEFTYTITTREFDASPYINNVPYMDPGHNYYYTHDKATGNMTQWDAGSLTGGDSTTYDYVAGMFPVAFWDIMGGSTFNEVRIFAAMCYLVYDSDAVDKYIKVYSIGNAGVTKVDYAVIIKHYNPSS